MGALPTSEPVAFRFAPYIKELREFFAVSRLHYGSPEDIFPVTERLQTSREFAEDMSSMVRAILLREGGSMAHAQLLEILAIAIGGPAMDHAPQDYRQPLRQLLSFLTGVLRRPWNLPPGEEAEPASPESVASYSTETGGFDHGAVVTFPSGPFAAAAALSAAERSGDRAPQGSESGLPSGPPFADVPLASSGPGVAEPAPAASAELHSAEIQPEPHDAADRIAHGVAAHDVGAPESGIAVAEAAESVLPAQAPAEIYLPDPPFLPMDFQAVPEPPAPPVTDAEPAVVAQQEAGPVPEAAPVAMEEPLLPAAQQEEPKADPSTVAASALAVEAAAVAPKSAEPTLGAPVTASVPIRGARVSPISRRIHGLSSPRWRDSPFDDSPEDEILADPPTPKVRHSVSAPWVSQAEEAPGRAPWMTPARRNAVLGGAAALLLAVGIAVLLHPTTPRVDADNSGTTNTGNTAVSGPAQESPAASASSAAPANTSAQSVSYGAPATGSQAAPRRSRRNYDEDEDYTGKDVAPPSYRSFVTPSAPASSTASGTANGGAVSQPASSAPSSPSTGASDPAPEDHRGAGSGAPIVRQFRNPDATLAGDPRPTRPTARSLSGDSTFHVSSGVMASNLISAPNPDYPTLARLAHIQGEVILQAVIARDGHVSATHVLSGHRLLRGAAVDAVKRWRYHPYMANGHPVDVATIIRVGFHSGN